MKLNLGSNSKQIEGFANVDALMVQNVDFLCDLSEPPYEFEDVKTGEIKLVENDSVDEIIAIEFLEHIPFRKTANVLSEWRRILKPGGKLTIGVPDIGLMCDYYTKGLICPCVPRKAASMDAYLADPACTQCHGKAMIHPERWLYAFSGAQKHEFDAHLAHFTRPILRWALFNAGFRNLVFNDNIYKLHVECVK